MGIAGSNLLLISMISAGCGLLLQVLLRLLARNKRLEEGEVILVTNIFLLTGLIVLFLLGITRYVVIHFYDQDPHIVVTMRSAVFPFYAIQLLTHVWNNLGYFFPKAR